MTGARGALMDASERETLAHLLQMREQLTLRHTIQKKLMDFERELCNSNRFFPRTDILGWVDAIAPMVMRTLDAGSTLFRGRIITKADEDQFLAPVYHALGVFIEDDEGDLGHTRFAEAYVQQEIERLESGHGALDHASIEDRLRPFRVKGWWGYGKRESDAAPSDATGNGRINPAGISYLYASNRRETAALEARPHISQLVSIAEVRTTDQIVLFDLTRDVFADDESPDDQTKMFRKLLAHYFSRPNYSGDQAYLVTQYISEYVKGRIGETTGLHFDGICFSSSLDRKGTNCVIFDTTEHPKYEIVSSSLDQVKDMQGTLETHLPMGDATVRALMDATL